MEHREDNIKPLSYDERISWLRLIRSERVGSRTFWDLMKRYKTASLALENLAFYAKKDGKNRSIPIIYEAEQELNAFAKHNVHLIAACEPDYPQLLRTLDDAPPLLAVQGSMAIFQKPMIAIVGSRNASAAGLNFTAKLARELGEAGFIVVSGFARGIDTRAHKTALQKGTVAVLAGGHARIYPSENMALTKEVTEAGGALVSEMPLTWEPRGQDFPRRNRIISGLSYGVIIVEGALRSGSMITARFALEQGREVFAVPGSPLDPRAEGPNALIREGAVLCASPEHILLAIMPMLEQGFCFPQINPKYIATEENDLFSFSKETAPLITKPQNKVSDQDNFNLETTSFLTPSTPPNDTSSLLSLLSTTPVHIDELARLSGVPIRTVQAYLMDMELDNKITRHSGNMVSKI